MPTPTLKGSQNFTGMSILFSIAAIELRGGTRLSRPINRRHGDGNVCQGSQRAYPGDAPGSRKKSVLLLFFLLSEAGSAYSYLIQAQMKLAGAKIGLIIVSDGFGLTTASISERYSPSQSHVSCHP
jgi:hypothetical protein